ncbi:glycosyltransferase family 2 protein [Chondrinema litorale]|uniref:glycosyltransferase family 2 protein n=1 Tax=Chondrinema litorale TaxID=2994555 RepID=UPI002543EAAF|nr:glycosyltransferase [Chondrinema litorale]UZR92533.1 glycosyltransferase [Chondrinema litorale]
MQFEPLISIVLTSYNQPDLLECAFESVINQTYDNIEIVVVDDASTERQSNRLIKSWSKKYPKKVKCFIQDSNVGIPKNKNTGFKLCNGQFITYLDGDDYYYSNKIEKEVFQLLENPELDIIYSNFHILDKSGSKINWNDGSISPKTDNSIDKIFSRNYPHGILFRYELIRASVLKRINYYDESIPAYHDWDSRIRYSSFSKIQYVDNIGSVYKDNPDSISTIKKSSELLLEMKSIIRKNMHLVEKNRNNTSIQMLKSEIDQQLFKDLLFYNNPLFFISYLIQRPQQYRDVLYRIRHDLWKRFN